MQVKSKYSVVSIRSYLSSDKKAVNEGFELGENVLTQILSEFSCEKNPDVDRFLKNSAIEFTKKNQSVTYLVFSVDDGSLLGYFTIAVKPLTVRGEMVDGKMSNRAKNKIKRVSELDEETQSYNMAAYLIAQLGKNYTDNANEKITGVELLELAWQVVEQMQQLGGGMVTFLEANNEEKLLKFYTDNGFQRFDTRQTLSKDKEPHELVQLLRLL
jgi:hypothetical protein